jgi:hypothetical protein
VPSDVEPDETDDELEQKADGRETEKLRPSVLEWCSTHRRPPESHPWSRPLLTGPYKRKRRLRLLCIRTGFLMIISRFLGEQYPDG